MKNITVSNIMSDQGNTIANQFRIIDHKHNTSYFQSYDSIIVKSVNGKVFLDVKYWKYSRTTGTYRNIFLGETRKETETKIKSGEYKLVNLN